MGLLKLNKLPYPDEGFPGRVFKTSAIISCLFVFYSFYFYSLSITLSLASGIFISFFTIKILWKLLSTVFVQSSVGSINETSKRLKTLFLTIGILKYVAVTAFLYFVFKKVDVNIWALLIGVSVIQIVIVFKIAGLYFLKFINKSEQVELNQVNK